MYKERFYRGCLDIRNPEENRKAIKVGPKTGNESQKSLIDSTIDSFYSDNLINVMIL